MKTTSGFTLIEVVVGVAVVAMLGGGVFVWQQSKASSDDKDTSTQDSSEQLLWQQTATGWQATETPPACPAQPMLTSPADVSQATAMLYPGQTRGMYKPHGGFRFDTTTDNAVRVTAPLDGFIVKGSRFLADGTDEVQYSFDILNNCGVMYRVGHLQEIPANLKTITDTFPGPSADSALYPVNPAVPVKQGDVLATKVGLLSTQNTFFDFGVYDFRQQNLASQAPSYQTAHAQDKELSWYAVCWLQDWLPAEDASTIASLPAGDPQSGKTSDYCR